MGPAVHTGLLVSRATQESAARFWLLRVRGAAITLYGAAFQSLPLTAFLAMARSYNPDDAETTSVLGSSRSLATTGGIILYFLFPAGTKMFQFPAFASHTGEIISLQGYWVVPFGIRAGQGPFAPHRGFFTNLSRPSSPCKSLGIHRTPFITFRLYCSSPIPPPVAGL